MKLSTPRYTLSLFFQLSFVLCDLIFNCVSLFPRSRDGLLVLFIFQDIFLVLSITSMLMTFFSTYLFQTGLVEVLWRKFRALACVGAAYVACSVGLHAAHAVQPARAVQSAPLLALYTLHRCLSASYYFLYKRAALRAADPRLLEHAARPRLHEHAADPRLHEHAARPRRPR